MALRYVIALMTFALAAAAMGADPEDRTHPLDDVPACMERGENAAPDSCVLDDSRAASPRMTSPRVDTEGSATDGIAIPTGPSPSTEEHARVGQVMSLSR